MQFKKRYIFYLLFIAFLFLGPLIVYNNPLFLGFVNKLAIINFIHRSTALMALMALTIQLFIGGNMDNLTLKYGGWLFKFHLILGIAVLGLIFGHVSSLFIFNVLASRVYNPFYVFTDMCLICRDKRELYISFGRISFWLLLASAMAAKLRVGVWWRRNWRYIHVFNYFIFYLISIHSYMVGSDTKSPLFLIIFILLNIIVFYTIANKVFRIVKTK